MLYSELLINRIEQACNVLESVSNFYEKEIKRAEVDGNKVLVLDLLHKKLSVDNEMLAYKREQIELATSTLAVIQTKDTDKLKEALVSHSRLLERLNNKYNVYNVEDGIKLML